MAALLGAASSTWGLGLGDIELDSALNEKLDAEIELIDAEGLQPTEIIVSLASADDFERIGVERFFFLTDLRFEVAYGPDGVQNVNVTSTQPVTEPYLNFLVEVLWPSGRMLKEYTLLLDPPTFSPAAAPAVAAPSQSREQPSGGAGRVERQQPAAGSGTRVQLSPGRAQQQASPLDEGVVGDEYRMTDRSDTLWSIAQRTRPSDAVTVHQNMLAIQRLNPEAFLDGNINRLKAGYTLQLPSAEEAGAVSGADAIRQVAMQNEDWRALQRGEAPSSRAQAGEGQVAAAEQTASDLRTPVDATAAAPRAQTTERGPDGELRIVAGAGETAAGGTDPETAEALNAAAEEQDRLGREVESLTEELEREREIASNQIAVKDRQLEVRDQQIAEMQAEIERLRQEMEQQRSAAQRQNQSASATQPWWQSPLVMWGGAGVVVLLLVYGLIAARRRRAGEDEFYPELAEGAFDEAPADRTARATAPAAAAAAAPAAAATAASLDLDDDDEALQGAGQGPHPVQETASAEAARVETSSETSDVIGEADIYIAYGRYPQAIGLLLGVLEEDPNRNDVRLKLLELYAETRDRDAFDAHMAELMERCDDDEALLTARELAQQFGGDDTAPPVAAVPDISADHDGDEALAFDDEPQGLDDLPEAHDSASEELELTSDEDLSAGPEGAEDFELELDDLNEQETSLARSARGNAGDALGGDLGIDFDPDRDMNGNGEEIPADLEAEALSSGDELDLDLDDDSLGDDAFDFADEGDTASTKLDLARAYIDMGDQDGARDILNEVVVEGNSEQQQRAHAMLEEL